MEIRIALAQFWMNADPQKIVLESAAAGADIIVFPEMWSNGYARVKTAEALKNRKSRAHTENSKFINDFCRLAKKYNLAILATFLEADNSQVFNSAVLIDRHAQIVIKQRKRYICFFDSSEDHCSPGEKSYTYMLDCKGGKVAVGVMICMDREFPEVGTDLARQGAEVVLVPNSSELVHDGVVKDVRTAGIRSRAFENVFGMAVANYPNPQNDGHSVIVDEFGTIIKQAGEAPGIYYGDLNIAKIRATLKIDSFRRNYHKALKNL